MQSLATIYTIGAAQGFILAMALWRKKVNTSSNKILSIWLLLMVFDLSMKTLYLNGLRDYILRPYVFVQLFPFLYGSFFYLYVRTLIAKTSFALKDLIHFAGFFFFLTINIRYIADPLQNQMVDFGSFDLLLYLYSVSYVFSGLYLIRRYRNNLKQQQVDIQDVDLLWLKIMGYSQVVIWFIAVSQWLLPVHGYNHWIIYVAVSVWMTLMGYLSLSQLNVPIIKPIKTPVNQQEERFDEVKLRLDQLIDVHKIHLEPSLTIGNLAKSSGYPEYLISLFINRVHGMSFRDYINELRIGEAKTMLADSNNKSSILDIAYACGFNSKSTFNSAFKKITRLTPSQFRQE